MGDMKDEDRKLLRDIHRCLLGDLENQGFIGETKEKFSNIEYRVENLEKYKKGAIGAIISVAMLFVTQIIQMIF